MRDPVVGECYYCGDVATTEDHVIPRVHRDNLEATMDPLAWREYIRTMPNTVPACGDCNVRKGSKVFDSVPDICEYLADALGRKYARVLAAPRWSEDEMAELGPRLGRDVRSQQRLARRVQRRISILRIRGPRSTTGMDSGLPRP